MDHHPWEGEYLVQGEILLVAQDKEVEDIEEQEDQYKVQEVVEETVDQDEIIKDLTG